jgi:hypothetical protein
MFATRALGKMAAKSAAPVARPIGSVIPPFHLALPVHNLDEGACRAARGFTKWPGKEARLARCDGARC